MDNAQPTVEAGLLERYPKLLYHSFHQHVHSVLEYLAQDVAVAVDRSGDQISLHRGHNRPVRQVTKPLSHEELNFGLCSNQTRLEVSRCGWVSAKRGALG